ncbi:TPA: hypothetical protein R3V32_001257 [Enterobacter cloacae]|nr:hypothetical protein [Enterobacter cloacae]
MNILLNHLSLADINDLNTSTMKDIFHEFACSLKLISLNTNIHEILLKGSEDINKIIFSNNKSLMEMLRECNDRDLKGIILARMANYTILNDFQNSELKFSLSFFSNENWKEIVTSLQQHHDSLKNILNIPSLKFCSLSKTTERAQILINFTSDADFDYLNTPMIINFYSNEFENAFTELCRSNTPEKRSIITNLAYLIATLSGYNKNDRISHLNRRTIFYNDKLNKYLSVDFLHGAFEVNDHRGRHQKEINFKGVITEDADSSGKHDIRIN